jgi:hypothetical protein
MSACDAIAFACGCAVGIVAVALGTLLAWLRERRELKPDAPICADTGQPKYPGNCWNVRCQLGGTCCRSSSTGGVASGSQASAETRNNTEK